jgi:hypothetical protein
VGAVAEVADGPSTPALGTGRAFVRLSWAIAGAAVLAGLGSSLVAWLEGPDAAARNLVGFFGLVVPFAAIGGVLASRVPGNAIGWLFLAIAGTTGVGQSAAVYAERGLLIAPGSLPGAREAALLSDLLWWVPLVLLLIWVVLLFPDGRPRGLAGARSRSSRRSRSR